MKIQTRYILSLIVACLFVSSGFSQKQLIVLKKQQVILRLYPGDEIIFRLKDSRKIRRSYVNNLYDTAFVAHNDIISYHTIDRIYSSRRNFLNVVGGLLVTGGIGYFVIDQVNVMLVHREEANINENVATASAIMVATGLPLMLLKKKYTRMGGKYRILTVDRGSGFYVPDMRRNPDEMLQN